MVKHTLVFYENKSTPLIIKPGEKADPPESYGKETSRRPATQEQNEWLRDNPGKWLRVDEKGNGPDDPGYKRTKMPGREHLMKHAQDDVLDIMVATGMSFEEALEHYGVKGMRWGFRKNDSGGYDPTPVTATQKPGSRVTTSGGKNLPASEDAISAAVSRQKVRSSSIDSLSNQELQAMVRRMQLEQNYKDIVAKNVKVHPAKRFIKKLFSNPQERQKTLKRAKTARNVANDIRIARELGRDIENVKL